MQGAAALLIPNLQRCHFRKRHISGRFILGVVSKCEPHVCEFNSLVPKSAVWLTPPPKPTKEAKPPIVKRPASHAPSRPTDLYLTKSTPNRCVALACQPVICASSTQPTRVILVVVGLVFGPHRPQWRQMDRQWSVMPARNFFTAVFFCMFI